MSDEKRNGHHSSSAADDTSTPRDQVDPIVLAGHDDVANAAMSVDRWLLVEAAFGAHLPAAWEDVVVAFARDPARARSAVAALTGAMLLASKAYGDAGLGD